ncbi:Retrovirus-related Pol polyprotein from transposon RE1 [Vitis vinifera]|uniref:Retrovirus-related Pol polyprotein from transposon RE1 n=1 Tax=Vitis vinifera TaxID=29760 RepID=A0A438FY96_VITVI|nr:Retrovirus-related Pol polyprotein from transposon RE1 [Vitis vinifera]
MSMMGELNFFLGLQIKQLKEGTFIDQAKYIRDLLKRFDMEEAKTMKTPMSSSIKFDKDEKCKSINSIMYRGMISSLLYLTASRPDIMYSVCLCARFQSCPKESHLSAVKLILRYLKGTMDIGLWYPKGDNFELIRFSDADFVGCKVKGKALVALVIS